MTSNGRASRLATAPRDSSTIPGLILLRHGEVASHRGDVPLTREGRGQAEQAGRRLAPHPADRVWILVGPTRRAPHTRLILLHGWTSAESFREVTGPAVTQALGHPD